jgi:molybdopterin synthase catalytic subunit
VYKDLEAQKEQIFNENKGKAGIYKWIYHTTGDIYIGSAVDLRKRLVY